MFAEIQGSTIYHEVTGEGPAVVFVHGLGGTCNVWHAQRHALQKFFKVVTLDLPGSGRSSKTEKTYSLMKWAEQIHGLADQLKLDKFVLVGHSMGTILAQNFAGQFGSRLHGMVLCGPLIELPAAGKEAFAKRAEAVAKDGMLGVADLVLGGALTVATREGNPAFTGIYRELLLSNDPASYIAQCHALMAASATKDLARITCPTLILVGEHDVVTPLANARLIAAAIKNTRIRIIPATAHLTMAERPESFNAALMDFLAELPLA